MTRYLRLYAHFLRFSFSKAMEFRVDFFFRFVMDIVFYIMQFLFFEIIYQYTPILGGWNKEEMTLFVCSFIFVDAFHMTFFASNAWWLPIAINKGDLDYYLTKPVSSFFFLSLKEFAANSSMNLILATSLLLTVLAQFSVAFSLFELLTFFILLLNGAVLYYAVYVLFLLSVFWTGSSRGFADVFFSVEKVFQKPDGIFSGYFRRVFLTFLPFCAMASLPTKFLIEPHNRMTVIFEVVVASLFVYLLLWFMWRTGLRNYSSASS